MVLGVVLGVVLCGPCVVLGVVLGGPCMVLGVLLCGPCVVLGVVLGGPCVVLSVVLGGSGCGFGWFWHGVGHLLLPEAKGECTIVVTVVKLQTRSENKIAKWPL